MHGMWEAGGVASYIRLVSRLQQHSGLELFFLDSQFQDQQAIASPHSFSSIFITDGVELITQAEFLNLDLLHLHTDIDLPDHLPLPVIRSVHNHNPYCLSGSKHLKQWSQPCDRRYSPFGCLWGHGVDRCGSVRPQNLLQNFRRIQREQQLLQRVSTITYSQFVKDQMVRSGYTANQIYVLLLPAPPQEAYHPPPQEEIPHFLFLGRITPEKGLDILLKAIATLEVPIHLDIAGTGNPQQEKRIQHHIEQLKLSDRVTVWGWVDEVVRRSLLHRSRAVIFPSVWHEPAGLVTLEAAAAGRAIVASRVGGIPEYATALENAILVAPNNPIALTKQIETLAIQYQEACRLGWMGYQNAIRFSLENHGEQLMQCYQRAIASKESH